MFNTITLLLHSTSHLVQFPFLHSRLAVSSTLKHFLNPIGNDLENPLFQKFTVVFPVCACARYLLALVDVHAVPAHVLESLISAILKSNWTFLFFVLCVHIFGTIQLLMEEI
jgi:hypothetical protein